MRPDALAFYNSRKEKYPFEIEVPSPYDIAPHKYEATYPFCRIPPGWFGTAIWMFRTQEEMDDFKRRRGVSLLDFKKEQDDA